MPTLNLKAVISADGRGLQSALAKTASDVDSLKEKIGGELKHAITGAFAVGSIYAASKAMTDYAKSLKIARDETGANVEDLQVWEYQAKKVGQNLENVQHLMSKMTEKRGEAIDDGASGEMSKRFQRLGVSFDDLVAKSPAEIFKQIQRQITATGDATRYAADIVKVFGKGAYEANAIFQTTFEASEYKARKLGLVVESEVIDRINSGMALLKQNFLSNRGIIAQTTGGSITAINEMIAGLKFFGLEAQNILSGGMYNDYYWNRINQISDDLYSAENPQDPDVAANARRQAQTAGTLEQIKSATAELAEKNRKSEISDEQRLVELLEKKADLEKQVAEAKGTKKTALKFDIEKTNSEIIESEKAIKQADSRDVKERETLQLRLLKLQIEALPIAEKLAALERQKLKYQQDYYESVANSKDELNAQIGIAETQREIDQLNKPQSPTNATIQGDSLARVGNFLGGGANAFTSIAAKQLDYLKTIAQNTAKQSSGSLLSDYTP